MILFFSAMILLICADQLIKYFTVTYLMPLQNIDVIKNVFSFSYVENFGAAFGILQNAKVFFIAFTAIITIAITVYTRKTKTHNKLYLSSICLILSGAYGNMIDRIFRGYVVDMLRVTFMDFPVFNFADCCVVIGAILLCVYVLFVQDKETKKSEKEMVKYNE